MLEVDLFPFSRNEKREKDKENEKEKKIKEMWTYNLYLYKSLGTENT